MASMVAKACSSTSSQMPAMLAREKGSRNKRKFRADPPVADATKVIPLPPNECTSFEFSAEKFDSHRHGSSSSSSCCDMCCVNHDALDTLKLDLGLSCAAVGTSEVGLSHSRELGEASVDEFHDTDWSDLTESELEELVLRNLDTIFKSAVKKIGASGYSEEVATRAILRSGVWYGCKDTVSNIVDNTLAFLRSGQEVDPSMEHCFEDLQQMEKYVLAELVCLLREVRPFFSTGDAMWCLLICDMNVSHACAMDGDPSGSLLGNATLNVSPSVSDLTQLRTELKGITTSNGLAPYKAKASVAYSRNYLSRMPKLASIRDGRSSQSEALKLTNDPISKPSFVSNGLIPDRDSQNSSSSSNARTFSATGITQTAVAEEKFVGSGKVSRITNTEYILRQKSTHLEKHNRVYGSKGASRAGKLSSFRGLVLDKKLKGVADSTGLTAKKSPFKINGAGEFDAPTDNFSSTFGLETVDQTPLEGVSSTLPMVASGAPPSLPVTDTELSLSYSTENIANPMPISYSFESSSCGYHGSPNDKPVGQWSPQDKKDEMIMKMVPRVRELQNQLQEWTEWANQKVMQAARRLSKDKAELKSLRHEREEIEKLMKERQSFQENAVKKIRDLECSLRKIRGKMEQTSAHAHRLEIEKAALRKEMEAAKLRAAESAVSCQEVSKREKNTSMKFQSWEKQKTIFQEELVAEKSKVVQLQQKLQQAKEVLEQVEAKLSQEEKAKDELRTQISSLRKEQEQIEASTQSEEAIIKSRAESNLSKHKEDIKRFEKEISQLRLKTDASKIAALRRGIDGGYVGKVTNSKDAATQKDMSRMASGVDFTGNGGGVRRERECVMCLSEEMSVVFLPCAHQVVCMTCNELHEKRGMKECPSCRSPIQRRVCVRYAHS